MPRKIILKLQTTKLQATRENRHITYKGTIRFTADFSTSLQMLESNRIFQVSSSAKEK